MKPSNTELPRLYMVSNCQGLSCPEKQFPELVSKITAHLPVIIQLREKHLTAKALYELALKTISHMLGNRSLLCINERFDVALAAGADGVHFPENSYPLDKALAASPGMVAGKSTHSLKQALSAEADGADYLIFGPVFETPMKKRYGPPMGPDKLSEVCRSVSVPVYAIGGITPQNTLQCLEHGAYGVAAMSVFYTSDNLGRTLDNFCTVLER